MALEIGSILREPAPELDALPCFMCDSCFKINLAGVVVAIATPASHFLADLLELPTNGEQVLDDVAVTVGTTFEFGLQELGRLLAVFVVKPIDVMDIVVVHDKSPRFLGDFAFGIFHVFGNFPNLEQDSPHVTGDSGEA
jgi:hypothetical protein